MPADPEGQFWGLHPGGSEGEIRKEKGRRGEKGRDGGEVGRGAVSGARGSRAHFRQDVDEVVQAREVAVLPVPLLPRDVVLQGLALGQGCGFPKVDHPHLGLFLLVVDEEEGAADHLEGGRDMRRGGVWAPPCPPQPAPQGAWKSLRLSELEREHYFEPTASPGTLPHPLETSPCHPEGEAPR